MKIKKKNFGGGGSGPRGDGGQGRCEWRSGVFVKIKKTIGGRVGGSGLM